MREGDALPDLDLRREARLLDPDLSLRLVPRGRLDLSEGGPRLPPTLQDGLLRVAEGRRIGTSLVSRAFRLHRPRKARQLPTMQSRYPLLKKWTAEEHERLKALAEAGWRPDEIAGELGRSEAAVRVRAWQHGIALRLVTQKRARSDHP
jgi:hypothetical protein